MSRGSRKHTFLPEGTEVITDELRVAIVDGYLDETLVRVRYHSPPWPFPEIDIKDRCHLTPVELQYEEAPF